MKKWLGYAAAAVGGIVIWAMAGSVGKLAGRSAVESYQQGKAESAIEVAQEEAAKNLRKQLPMKINELTTLLSVMTLGPTLIYNYRIDANRSDIDLAKFTTTMSSNLQKNVCGHKEMLNTIKCSMAARTFTCCRGTWGRAWP